MCALQTMQLPPIPEEGNDEEDGKQEHPPLAALLAAAGGAVEAQRAGTHLSHPQGPLPPVRSRREETLKVFG